ncbi:MAG TPA: TetR family transcriptional regulator, partial [Actinobacteria bacterium]|nr:TetR family transcriptional regulator [Actinomycetota bacterium]
TSVLAGQRTADEALRILRYQLDRLLPGDEPAVGRPQPRQER